MTIGKVLLVNYAGYWMTANSFIADSSLALLAGVLLEKGIETEIVDFQNTDDIGKIMEYQEGPWAQGIIDSMKAKRPLDEKDLEGYWKQRTFGQEQFEKEKTKWLLDKIKNEHVTAIGFKLWIGNGLKGAIFMAKEIKKHFPKVKLIAGGPGVQFAQQYFYEYTDAFDHAVYGEAEEILIPLLEGDTSVYNLMTPDGKMTRKDFTKDINQTPAPSMMPRFILRLRAFIKCASLMIHVDVLTSVLFVLIRLSVEHIFARKILSEWWMKCKRLTAKKGYNTSAYRVQIPLGSS